MRRRRFPIMASLKCQFTLVFTPDTVKEILLTPESLGESLLTPETAGEIRSHLKVLGKLQALISKDGIFKMPALVCS